MAGINPIHMFLFTHNISRYPVLCQSENFWILVIGAVQVLGGGRCGWRAELRGDCGEEGRKNEGKD